MKTKTTEGLAILADLRRKPAKKGRKAPTRFLQVAQNTATMYPPILGFAQSGCKQAVVGRRDSYSSPKQSLWLYDLTRAGASTRFTFGSSFDSAPLFSPDGSRIVFSSDQETLYQKLTSGVKNEEPLLRSAGEKSATSWSLDGRFLLYVQKGGVWILPMSPASDGSPRQPMLFQEVNGGSAQFSPDGHWIAYTSNESGRDEVYVREFSLDSDGKPVATPKHQISTSGGSVMQWRDDSKELIYLSFSSQAYMASTQRDATGLDENVMLSAAIVTKPAFQSQPGTALFHFPLSAYAVAVTADGKRFLVAMPVNQSGPRQFTVVQNWQALLKKRPASSAGWFRRR